MEKNPFIISGYVSPDYFCDRDAEARMINDAISNRRHLTIFSPRRIGKTGLIRHVFYLGQYGRSFIPVYTDILSTVSIRDFTETFGRSVLSALAKNESSIKKILKILASIRPKAAIDPITGEPYISLVVLNEREAFDSLDIIFRYLQTQKSDFAIAIDEFQQVSDYPEKNTEAMLRTYIQQTSNATFIFSGSRKHILTGIFTHPDRPFYNSTQVMEIGKISKESYSGFISGKFEQHGIRIENQAIEHILGTTSIHTFYVQFLCNRLFGTEKKITTESVNRMLLRIIGENEAVYASYISVLTPLQYKILRAVAVNDGIQNPTSSEFLSQYNLGAASSVSLAVKSLSEKGFLDIYDGKYALNDKFFNFWLKYKTGVY